MSEVLAYAREINHDVHRGVRASVNRQVFKGDIVEIRRLVVDARDQLSRYVDELKRLDMTYYGAKS